jgi:hypothetical protein
MTCTEPLGNPTKALGEPHPYVVILHSSSKRHVCSKYFQKRADKFRDIIFHKKREHNLFLLSLHR